MFPNNHGLKVESDIAAYSVGGSSNFDGGPFHLRQKRRVCFWCGWWINGKDAFTVFEVNTVF